MRVKKAAKRPLGNTFPEVRKGKNYTSIVLERFRRLNSFPSHTVDYKSQIFISEFLGGRKHTTMNGHA